MKTYGANRDIHFHIKPEVVNSVVSVAFNEIPLKTYLSRDKPEKSHV